ncbi:hypothetical protein M2401_002134 [Pseudomonas sp. JUb42]|uniref:beta strand repeat-containing protein n=1 Tax=Pseudomonas sp. JUb42 TaxID=2940611 RepID=UPI0021699CE5|nr:DUF4214 domain-containing protein [Pseudomonas sp. JUb42]MCS3468407.1 hypothetical protein [Pseudomonas sp. JUb42]
MAASAYVDQIQKLYIAYFGRPADPVGLNYWATQVDAAGGNLSLAIAGFSASLESAILYGSTSSTDKITAIYLNLFNRNPEPAGLSYWVQQLDQNTLSPSNAAWQILTNAGAGDAQSVANKLAIANAFTAQLDTAAEIKGYGGANAGAFARQFLRTVDSTSASVVAATSGLSDAVVRATTPTDTSPGSRTFTFTTGVDNFFGGDGNDTAIGDESTFTPGNFFYGGDGIDTLIMTMASLHQLTGSLQHVEIVNITSASGGTFSAPFDVTTVNLTVAGNGLTTLDPVANSSVTTAGSVSIVGAGANSITIKDSSGISIIRGGEGTLALTLDHVSAPTAQITASAILNSLTLKNQQSALSLDLSSAASANLALNLQDAGYAADGSVVGIAITAGTITKNLALVASGTKSAVGLTGNALESILISGSSALSLDVAAQSGSTASKLTSIDGSTATGNLLITTHAATTTGGQSALAIKTGSGNDLISVATSSFSGSLAATVTTGTGKDTVDVSNATLASLSNKQITTITDLTRGQDSVKFAAGGTFNASEVNVSTATSLDAAITAALGAVSSTQWFKYAGDTYLVNNDNISGLNAADIVVKLSGTLDLSSGSISATGVLSFTA